MVRPKHCRFIGTSARKCDCSEVVRIGSDELEALRLQAIEGLHQHQSSDRMGISRATFGRILKSCMRKVACALVNGATIEIVDVPWVVSKKNMEEQTMEDIIAIPVFENNGDANVSEHFGRAPYFAIVSSSGNVNFIPNDHDKGCEGVVRLLKDESASVLLVKGIGGRPKIACDQMGIKVFRAYGNTVSECVKAYTGGSVETNVSCGHGHDHGHTHGNS